MNKLRDKQYILIYIPFIILMLNRMIRKTPFLKDIFFHLAGAYGVHRGDVPLISSWDVHTGWILVAPLMWIYERFFPSMEGIVLYTMVIYFVFSFMLFWVAIRVLRAEIKSSIICLSAWFYVPCVLFSVYYSITAEHLFIVVACILYAYVNKEKRLPFYIAGIATGIACVEFPTMVVLAIMIAIYIGIMRNSKKSRWMDVITYLAGGMTVAIPFSVWILLNGSMRQFISGIKGVLSNPHGEVNTFDIDFFVRVFIMPFGRIPDKSYSIPVLLIFTLIGILLIRYQKKDQVAMLLRRFHIFWFIFFGYVIVYALSSDSNSIFAAIKMAVPILVFTVAISCAYYIDCYHESRNKNVIGVALIIVLAGIGIFHMYSSSYEHGVVVSRGVLKGVYVPEEEVEYYISMEETLNQYINHGDKLCVLDCAPEAYIMARAKVCTPFTWNTYAYPWFTYTDTREREGDPSWLLSFLWPLGMSRMYS